MPRWLEARIGLPADIALVRELRDICGRVAELIDLFAEADIVLEATLHESLTREAFGLGLESNRRMTNEQGPFRATARPGKPVWSREDRLQAPRQRLVPDPESVRLRLKALLERPDRPRRCLGPSGMPRMWQTVFPNMAKWLPEEEADSYALSSLKKSNG